MPFTAKDCKRLLEAISNVQAFHASEPGGDDAMYGHLLESFVELTGSEYGVIGKVEWKLEGQPYFKSRAITETAWNEVIRSSLHVQCGDGLKLDRDDNLIGAVLTSGKPVIANHPRRGPRSGVTPPGHPAINTFMGLPIHVAGTLVGVVCVANSKDGYNDELPEFLLPLLNTCGHLISVSASDREWLSMQSKLESQRLRLESKVAQQTAEIKQNRKKIQAHEQYLQTILDNSPIAILISDLGSGVISFANHKAIDLMAVPTYDEKYADGAHYWMDPAERARIVEELTREGQVSADARLKTFDGRELQTLLTAQLNPENSEEAIWWISDLTPLTDLRNRFHQHQGIWKQVVENLPVALFVKDIEDDYRYTIVNRKHEELFGLPAEVLLGHSNFDFQDFATATEIRQEDLSVVRTGKPLVIPEEQYRTVHGDELILRTVKLPLFGDGGKPAMILGICEDLTEKKYVENALRNSERRFRQLADTAPVGIYLTDPKGGCVYVNEQWRKIAGLSQEQAAGDGWSVALHKDDRAAVKKAWERLVAGQSDFSMEYRMVTPDGKITWVSGTAIAFTNTADQVMGFVGTLADITWHKTFESQLKLSRDEAQRANAAKSEFISRMSHELRTPLNAVLGFGQLLQLDDENLSENQKEGVSHILSGGNHLLSLIEDVLDFSHIESGKLKMNLTTFPLEPVVQSSLSMVASLAQQGEVRIISHSDPSLHVTADSQRTKQVLINLLSNAVKYNETGGTVTVDMAEQPGNMLRISIADTGCGIRLQDYDRVFQPFERVSYMERSIDGTGIGLNISKQLVELMGGRIGFSSTPGTGSTFWFELPKGTAN